MSAPTRACVIGCDLGSQSLKGVATGPDGAVLATADATYDLRYPKPGFVEQDPGDWMTALEAVVRALLRDADLDPAQVGTLAIAAQLDGLVPTDRRGCAVSPAILWMDRRALAQCRELGDRTEPARVFDITGLNLDAAHVAPKAMWLRDHEPDAFQRASWLPSPGSHIIERLTGERVLDPTNASSTMLYDLAAHDWSGELLAASGLEPRMFGRVVPSSEVVGELLPAAAERLGLSTDTRVAAGCGDDHAGCLGAGLVGDEVVGDVVGTAEPIGATTRSAIRDPERLVETHFHAPDGLWLVQNPGFVSGGSIRWCCELLGIARADEFFELAASAPPGADGVLFLPCLGGATTPAWNDAARGAFSGLSLSHGPAHIARAVVEGCVFAFRDVVDQIGSLGIATDEVRVVGGGARSAFWCQLKADVSGRTLRCVRGDHATAQGAAMLAGVANGNFASLSDAAEVVVQVDQAIRPRPELRALYDDAYQRYRDLYFTMEPEVR
jgi:xylulokinase